MKKFKLNNKGFNLVELLVVMAIIAILVGILIYTINAARLQQRNTQRRSIMNTTRAALEAYYAKCKDYPVSRANGQVDGLLANPAATVCASQTAANGISNYAPGIDPANREDPSGAGNRLCYRRVSRTQYWLWAVTEPNAAAGTCAAADPTTIAGAEDFSVR